MEGEESRFSDAPSTGLHMDMDREASEESEEPIVSEDGANGQTKPGEEAKANLHTDRHWCSWNWESIVEESEELAYDDPHSSSDATIMGADSLSVPPLSSREESGNSLPTTVRGPAPHAQGSPMEQMSPLVPAVTTPASGVDTVEVHVQSHGKMEGGGLHNIFSIYFVIKDLPLLYKM